MGHKGKGRAPELHVLVQLARPGAGLHRERRSVRRVCLGCGLASIRDQRRSRCDALCTSGRQFEHQPTTALAGGSREAATVVPGDGRCDRQTSAAPSLSSTCFAGKRAHGSREARTAINDLHADAQAVKPSEDLDFAFAMLDRICDQIPGRLREPVAIAEHEG